MNDLDKRIAELKGYRIETRGPLTMILPPEGAKPPFKDEPPDWSTSDAKALELVDELIKEGFSVMLFNEEATPTWVCQIDKDPEPDPVFVEERPTRPEAICRAYIASREWMATKAGA